MRKIIAIDSAETRFQTFLLHRGYDRDAMPQMMKNDLRACFYAAIREITEEMTDDNWDDYRERKRLAKALIKETDTFIRGDK